MAKRGSAAQRKNWARMKKAASICKKRRKGSYRSCMRTQLKKKR